MATAILSALLAACGGGGGDAGNNPAAATGDATGQGTTPPAAGTGTPADTGATPPPGSDTGSNNGAPPTSSFAYDTTARFNSPGDLALDSAGNLLVHDKGNALLRRVATSGAVSTLPGTYARAFDELASDVSGNVFMLSGTDIDRIGPDGERARVASFPQSPGSYLPVAIAAGQEGNVHVLLQYRNSYRVNEVAPGGTMRTVYAFMTTGTANRIAVDAQGNLAVGFFGPLPKTSDVRFVPKALQPTEGVPEGVTSVPVEGTLNNLAYDAAGNLLVAALDIETGAAETVSGMRLVRMAPDRTVQVVSSRFPGGAVSHTQSTPITVRVGLAPDARGNVYITNPFDHAVYSMTPAGEATLVAGKPGEAGNAD